MFGLVISSAANAQVQDQAKNGLATVDGYVNSGAWTGVVKIEGDAAEAIYRALENNGHLTTCSLDKTIKPKFGNPALGKSIACTVTE